MPQCPQEAEGTAARTGRSMWLPEASVTLQPFVRPDAKGQRASLASHLSHATSQQASDAGGSAGADGSNNDVSRDSDDVSREPQSLGVSDLPFPLGKKTSQELTSAVI